MLKEKFKRIAFAVHEDKYTELIEWSYFNKDVLNDHEIIACGRAGNILEGTLNIPVTKLPEAPLGGFQLLNSYITENKVDILIFFWNDSTENFLNTGTQSLLSAAVQANIVIIHNRVSADCLLLSACLITEEEKLTA